MYMPSPSMPFMYCSVSEILPCYFIWPYPPERLMLKLIALNTSGLGQGILSREVSVSCIILPQKEVLQTPCLTIAETEPSQTHKIPYTISSSNPFLMLTCFPVYFPVVTRATCSVPYPQIAE